MLLTTIKSSFNPLLNSSIRAEAFNHCHSVMLFTQIINKILYNLRLELWYTFL